eukprot:Rmarinus@m.26745
METQKKCEYDPLRDGPLRFLGYSNEIGEAFRLLMRLSWVRFTYAVAGGYVIVDTADKAHPRSSELDRVDRMVAWREWSLPHTGDTLLWHTMASIAIPGFTINRVVYSCNAFLNAMRASPPVVKWGPTMVGLFVIPLIVQPIDTAVEYGMDVVLRPYLYNHDDSSKKTPPN